MMLLQIAAESSDCTASVASPIADDVADHDRPGAAARRRRPRRSPADRACRATPAAPAVDASTITAAGVPRDQPRSISRHAIAADRPSPISTTSVTPFGWQLRDREANASSSWPETTRNADATPRCVTGMPAGAGAAIALLMPGTTSYGHAGALQRERFFAAAAEHERVAALQPHDAAAAARGADHQRVNRRLRHRMAAGALADVEALRAARVAQDPVVDQRVVEHEVGGAQPRDRRARQQPGIAGPGADERDMSLHSHESSGPFSHGTRGRSTWALADIARTSRSRRARRRRGVVLIERVQRLQQPRLARGHRHAVAPPRHARGPRLPHPGRQIARQQRVEPLAQQRGQRRRVAAGRDRERHAVAPDDAAQERGRVGRIVDRVDEEAPRLGRLRDLAVDLRRRRGHDQPRVVEIGRRERRAVESSRTAAARPGSRR